MKKFCYRCGALEASAGPLIQGLCQRCFLGDVRLLQAPKEIQVTICKGCNAYQIGNQWHSSAEGESVEDIIKKTALSSIKIIRLSESGTQLLSPQVARDVKVTVKPDMKGGLVKILVNGKAHELQTKPKTDEASAKLSLVYRFCGTCYLKKAGHYEAVLQVRGELSREKISSIKTLLERFFKETCGSEDFIAEVKEQQGGLDFYISSAMVGRKMASMLKDKFGAYVSQSAKLIGQTKDGRRKYKVTILVELSKK